MAILSGRDEFNKQEIVKAPHSWPFVGLSIAKASDTENTSTSWSTSNVRNTPIIDDKERSPFSPYTLTSQRDR